MATDRIETLIDEQRRFTPPDQFKKQAHVHDTGPYDRARTDPEGYWADWAKQLEWIRPWDRVLEWKPPHAKWFLAGKLNASVHCLDRHVRAATAGGAGRVARVGRRDSGAAAEGPARPPQGGGGRRARGGAQAGGGRRGGRLG